MAHIHNDVKVIERLTAHRDQIQHIIDQVRDGIECGGLLASLAPAHASLRELCGDLTLEHLQEHVVEVEDRDARTLGAKDVTAMLGTLLQGRGE